MYSPTDPYVGMTTGSVRPYAGQLRSTTELPKGPLTLSELTRVALANNPEFTALAPEVDATAAQRDLAKGQRLPSLHAIGGYSHYLDGQRLIGPRESGDSIVYANGVLAGDLVVTMPLFTGGRITSEIGAAELLRKAAEHQLARTRDELIFNISSVFYGILAQHKVIESLEFSEKTLQEHLRRVHDLVSAEKSAKVDQLRTEVRIADMEQQLVRERNVLAVQTRVLTNMLGLDRQDTSFELAGQLNMTDATVPVTDEAVAQARTTRSDYLAARAALEAQAKMVDAARAARWPTVSLQGTYGGRWAADAKDSPAGAERMEDVGTVGIVGNIPLFEGGRIKARIRQENARLRAARERLRQLELQIRLDVETAVLNVSSARERIEAMDKAIEQAKESFRIEREKYDLGKGAVVDVLDAQSALLESQTNYYRALADHNVALAQLKLAMGKS